MRGVSHATPGTARGCSLPQTRRVILVFSDLDPSQRRQLEARRSHASSSTPPANRRTSPQRAGQRIGPVASPPPATRHLLELGHRRIAVIGAPARVWCSRARTDGYRAALENAEIEVNSAFIRHGDFHVESGHEQRDELLRLQNRPTEVFAESDLQTRGLYRADRELDCGSPRTCQSPVRTTCPSRGGSVPR